MSTPRAPSRTPLRSEVSATRCGGDEREGAAVEGMSPMRADPAGLSGADRLDAVARSGLLDSPVEESFERATRLASQLLGVPVSLVSIVTDDRQFFKSARGLAEPWATRRQTPLSHSFCQHVVAGDQPLVVEDSQKHPLVADNAAIEDLSVAAYLGVPFRDETGQPLGALCAIDNEPRRWDEADVAALEDVAELLRTELRLRAASRELSTIASDEHAARRRGEHEGDLRFTRLAESATDAVFVLGFDPEPTLLFLNPAIERLTGYAREVLIDDPGLFSSMLDDEDHSRLQLLLDDDSQDAVELRVRHRDGTVRWVSLVTTVLADARGAVTLVQGVVRDIDQHKRGEVALRASLDRERAAAERAARLNEMISTFLTAISHELRTPLTSVLGFADVLATYRTRLTDVQQDHLVQRLRLNAHRLQHLLEDVLDVDRLARGDLEPQIVRVRMDDVVGQIVAEADDDHGRVTVDVPPLEVVCDAGHLERIVSNLVGNALRHTAPGTPVVVRASSDLGRVVLTVEDRGPGIPDDLKREVFQPFVHGPQAADSPSPGTGLGLTLARELAELNGGTVELGDRPGGGARLDVTLPEAATTVPLAGPPRAR